MGFILQITNSTYNFRSWPLIRNSGSIKE